MRLRTERRAELRRRPQAARPRRRWRSLLILAVVGVIVAFAVPRLANADSLPFGWGASGAQKGNPFAERGQYVDPNSAAASAASAAAGTDDGRLLERLAALPTGSWLTPERYPQGSVGDRVDAIQDAARAAGTLPVFVVYGIPDRDCTGGESAGGLSPDQYDDWVGEIASAMRGSVREVAIVEPDALASATACGEAAQRTDLIAEAVGVLRDAGATVYIDAGHSDWLPPETMASLLRSAGVESVRGFATNVSNFQSDADEKAYAEAVSAALGGSHYVIDSGRNGAGSDGQWCNPPGRALGTEPGFVEDATGQDAYVWVKPPGESDGACGSGPGAGEWWTEGALALARQAGW